MSLKQVGVVALAGISALAAILLFFRKKKGEDITETLRDDIKDKQVNCQPLQVGGTSSVNEKGTLDYKTEQKCSTTDEIVTDAERDKVKTNFEIKPMEVQDHNFIIETRNTDITNKTESLMEWIDRQLAEAELKSRSTTPLPDASGNPKNLVDQEDGSERGQSCVSPFSMTQSTVNNIENNIEPSLCSQFENDHINHSKSISSATETYSQKSNETNSKIMEELDNMPLTAEDTSILPDVKDIIEDHSITDTHNESQVVEHIQSERQDASVIEETIKRMSGNDNAQQQVPSMSDSTHDTITPDISLNSSEMVTDDITSSNIKENIITVKNDISSSFEEVESSNVVTLESVSNLGTDSNDDHSTSDVLQAVNEIEIASSMKDISANEGRDSLISSEVESDSEIQLLKGDGSNACSILEDSDSSLDEKESIIYISSAGDDEETIDNNAKENKSLDDSIGLVLRPSWQLSSQKKISNDSSDVSKM